MPSTTTPGQHPQVAAYEQALPAEERLRKGQYYTPSAVCDLMIALSKPEAGSNEGPLRVLEPGCGPGSFLLRLSDWLETMPPAPRSSQNPAWELHGVELDTASAQLAESLLRAENDRHSKHYKTHVHTLNFISPTMDTLAEALGPFDWIIGNPPYVRQEHLAQAGPESKQEMLSYLVGKYAAYLKRFPEQRALFSQTGDLYLWFFLQATTLLKPGGRLAFITSNSWLNTAYGQHFQQFLTHHFHLRVLAESACERWFPDAAINPLITVLERKTDAELEVPDTENPFTSTGKEKPVLTIRIKKELNHYFSDCDPENYWPQVFRKTGEMTSPTDNSALQVNRFTAKELSGEPFKSNWAMPLRAPAELIQLLGIATLWQRLDTLGRVRYPLKTGINAFFYLSREKALEWGIEPEFLFPVLRSSRQVKHYRIEERALCEVLFSCPLSKQELQERGLVGALRYIEWGETQSAPPRQKRAQAVPWPQVASVRSNQPWHYTRPLPPAHLLCPRFIDQRFFFPLCQGQIIEDQTFYGLTLTQPKQHPPLLIAALLNSTLSYLLAEFSGRTNLGEGVLQFARTDMAAFPLINPDVAEMPE